MPEEAATVLPPREPDVQVEAYRGPLDLLLFLIKEEEVDVYDIPIALILKRYLKALETLPTVDINQAADFILMAATLMEIKSRQMLPPEQREALELEEVDPRTDLVRQLLEYRRFREAADELGERGEQRALLFGRARFGQGVDFGEAPAADPSEELKDVGLYDLMAAFERLMKATLDDLPRTIVYDDISVEERIEELRLTLNEAGEGQLRFREFVKRAADRSDAAAIFVAVLEAARRKLITVFQPEATGEIYIMLRGEKPDAELAPSAEEQAKLPTAGTLAARKGAFGGFIETADDLAAEDDDRDFAGDAEGRKAVQRLETATRRAEEAIKNFVKPTPSAASAAPPPPIIRQWTDQFEPPEPEAPGAGLDAAEMPESEEETPQELEQVLGEGVAPAAASLLPPIGSWTDAERNEPLKPPASG